MMMNQYRPEINCQAYLPKSIFAYNQNASTSLRLARYLSYLWQVKSHIKNNDAHTLYHICDHGYAHLLNVLPPQNTIVTVHDLIPLLRYKGLIANERASKQPLLSQYSLSFLKKAAHIVAISESTKQDLIHFNLADEKNISVVYSGLLNDDTYDNRSKDQCRESIRPFIINDDNGLTFSSNDEKYLLICGNSFYKNLPLSIKIYQQLSMKHTNIKVIHWGRHSDEWQHAKSLLANSSDIIEIPYLPDSSTVKALYKSVDCVLSPSLYEGFGLPPIEAMALGTPAVTSNLASLPEAVGDIEYCCDIHDINDINAFVSKIERLLFDLPYRQKGISHGLNHSKQFTWKKTIDQLADLYQSI